ncbi:MAG: hypothetical protein PF637_02205 [Spirochaetes bacterium]|jgi:hypothetical protein|nr:hypothetical protein [Spirochaetota bacterium]
MKKNKFLLLLLLVFILVLSSCGTAQKKETISSDDTLDIIRNINDRKPETVRANVAVNLTMERMSSVHLGGTAYLQNSPTKVRIRLNEPVFNSPVMELFADERGVTIYYPIDKRAQKISGGISDDSFSDSFDSRLFIAYAFTCKIPVIPDYSVSKHSINGKSRSLTLENSNFIEEISIYANDIKKIIITDKKSDKIYTIEYRQMFEQDGYIFFKSIQAYIPGANEKITVHYMSVFSNPSFNKARIFNLAIPEGTTIIR